MQQSVIYIWHWSLLHATVRYIFIYMTRTYTACNSQEYVIYSTRLFCMQQPDKYRAGHSLFFSRFPLCSLLIFYPWIAIVLLLILRIFRFAHRSIALKKTVVRSWKRALKCSIAPKTIEFRFFKIATVSCKY